MIKSIAATALAGFISLGCASPAAAHHNTQQPYVESEVKALMEAILRTGHRIFLEGDKCTKGSFGRANSNKQLLLCVDNHGDDYAELADTLRHETIHLAQFCRGRRRGAVTGMLFPDQKNAYIDLAVHQLHMPIANYPASKHGREAEARVLAHVMDEHQVATLLVDECREE